MENKMSKVIITIVIVVVFFVLFGAIVGATDGPGGIVGLALFAGAVGGIKAIWKKDDKDKNDGTLQD